MTYELERPDTEPSLPEMTRAALGALAPAPGGFVVQIEGGRVDHAAHENDAGAMIRDQAAFDETLGLVLDFVAGRDDTLLIVTTDHGCGNPGLTDYGASANDGFARLHNCRHSFEWILARLRGAGAALSIELVRDTIRQATDIALEQEDLQTVGRWLGGRAVIPFRLANGNGGPLGSVLANHFKVAFATPEHTSDFVELTALGPGSERIPGFLRINEVHGLMLSALDLPPTQPT